MTVNPSPNVVVIAGPNGAGKSTTAPRLLHGTLHVQEFVNADTIAAGLSAFAPESVALAAGRIMLERIDELTRQRADFAFETTLASRSFAPRLRHLQDQGYHVRLIFLALPDPNLAVARVAHRVSLGGHNVPEQVIRRRFQAGIRNFFRLYQPLADQWRVYDNSGEKGLIPVAQGHGNRDIMVMEQDRWQRFQQQGM